jgi:hypothetical protein
MKRYILTLMVALGAITGCKDYLTEEPIMSQSDKLTLSTYKGLDQATAASYAPLASTSWYGADFILINELKTSNGKKYIGTQFDTGRLNSWYNINYTKTTTSAVWGAAYYIISSVNNVLANLDGKGAAADLNNLKAECLFLRAFSHFDAVRTYAQPYCYTADASHAGVPIITEPQDPSDRPARNTVAEVYNQIITDLTEAEGLIAADYKRAGAKNTASVVSKEAIQALLSRVYLYMENWGKAAEYATKVIDSNKYEMWTVEDLTDSECFREDGRSSGEVIFEVYGALSESYGGGNEGICSMTSKNKYGDGGASLDLINLYEDGDIRGTLFLHEKDEKSGKDVYWTSKYVGKGLANPDVANVIVLRLSEMYLNRAEATIKGGLTEYDAVADITMVASNRGAAASPATASGVLKERQKELAWEGHLWFDLGRTKTNMTRTDVADGVITEVEWGTNIWAMPIPEREHNANPNLSPNPGY